MPALRYVAGIVRLALGDDVSCLSLKLDAGGPEAQPEMNSDVRPEPGSDIFKAARQRAVIDREDLRAEIAQVSKTLFLRRKLLHQGFGGIDRHTGKGAEARHEQARAGVR